MAKDKKTFIVVVYLELVDCHGITISGVADIVATVIAESEDDACRKAVLWNSDNGKALKNDEFQWQCIEPSRSLSWTAKRCTEINEDDLMTFQSVTSGLTDAKVCK